VAEDRATLLQQAKEVITYQPDAVEWRVDKFKAVRDAGAVLDSLGALREAIADTPLIFTCRIIHEGGFQEISEKDRLEVNRAVIASGMIDLIDTELCNGEDMIGEMKEACARFGVRLILSYHNFKETPSKDDMVERLAAAGKLGADVAKVAVMPKNYGDVLALLGATYKARVEILDIPIITMSMGGEGAITRIAGGLFGSDLTFAIGKASSAPGQIPIGEIRKAWEVLPYDKR
jgi:3-dehydroquinate dehydratase-1